MEITKGTLPNGNPCIEFKDQFDEDCRISINHHTALKFNIVWQSAVYFSQEDVKALLPYLQAFAESGTLEPSPLQGGDERVDMLAKASAKRVLDALEEKNKCIQDLTQLVKEWREFAARWGIFPNSSIKRKIELYDKTAQLLNEEE